MPAVAAALLAAALISAAGASAASKGAAKGTSSGSLTIAFASPPNSLDPSKSAVGLYANYVDTAYASLLNLTPNGAVTSGLATKWGYVGTGNKTFRLTLGKGLKWANGTPITASEVVASLQYFSKGSGPSSPYLAGMKFTASGKRGVTISSANPDPMIPYLLTPEYLAGAIISPAGLKTPAKLATASYGAGEYVYDAGASVSGDHYVYTANKNYYDPSAILYKQITIRVITDTNSAVEALKSGQVQLIDGTPEAAAAVGKSSSLVVSGAPSIWAGIFLLDRDGTVVPALKNPLVREALNYAVDRSLLTKAVYGKFAVPNDEPAVPGFNGYSASVADYYQYNPAKAKQLLAQAGYASGLTIPINYGSFDPDATKLVQAVQAEFAAVGVTLQLTADQNFGQWVSDLVSKKFAATILSPGSGGPSFLLAQSQFMPGGIMNVFDVSDPQITSAFSQLASAPLADSQVAADHVTNVAVKQGLELPISGADAIVIYNKKLQGVQFIKGQGVTTFVTQWSNS